MLLLTFLSKKTIFAFLFRYLATELCSGTMEDLVNKGRYTGPSVGSRTDVLRQVLNGISHLHLLEIVHGDLKPTNILISIPFGAVCPMIKLTDFGLHHRTKSFSLNGDPLFSVACTESWKAPESELTFAGDMFTFALVCGFSLFDGGHPYGEHDWEIIGRIKNYALIVLTPDQLIHVDPSVCLEGISLLWGFLVSRVGSSCYINTVAAAATASNLLPLTTAAAVHIALHRIYTVV